MAKEQTNDIESDIKNDQKQLEQGISKELEENKKIAKDYLDTLQRLQAEFENYQKRISREKQDIISYSKEGLIISLLEITDNFERALKSIEKAETKEQIREGISLIFQQFKKILEQEGVKAIESKNKPFNPNFHEAITKEHNKDLEENTITEEFLKGYTLKGKVIRPSKVKISTKEAK